jgi:hypothetical protein
VRGERGFALVGTLVFMLAAVILVGAAVVAWWSAHEGAVESLSTARARYGEEAAVAYAVRWLEGDLAASSLDTSTPAATLQVPQPAGVGTSSVPGTAGVTLDDPASSVTIGGPGQITVEKGVTYALAAAGFDSHGNQVSLNDLTLDWQAVGTGSSPGAVTWVAPGEFQATSPGTVDVTVPEATTASGSVIRLSSNTVQVTVTSGGPGVPSGLFLAPSSAVVTLGASLPVVAEYVDPSGQETTVTSCVWGASGSAVSLTPTAEGAVATAGSTGQATVSCQYTPPGGQPLTAEATVTVVYPTRVVTVTAGGTSAVVEVTGPSHHVLSWSEK